MQSLSRRSPRYRIDTAATAVPLLGGDIAACRTLDVSESGLSLDTAAWFPLGTRLAVALVDPTTGSAIEGIGDVVREAAPPRGAARVPAGARRPNPGPVKPAKRMRVLVFGDDHRQRGAMALYVTSGWDVLFATDEDSIAEIGRASCR